MMSMLKYILIDNKIVVCDDILEWVEWFEKKRKPIDFTKLDHGVEVSTIFLGIDHGYNCEEPVLFETMIFGGHLDHHQERCCTYEEALLQHKKVVWMATEHKEDNKKIE